MKVETKEQEWTTYFSQVGQQSLAPMYELGWGSANFDADFRLTPLLTTGARLAPYSNPLVDKLVTDARFELDANKRRQLYSRALVIIKEDAPWIFLFQYEDLYASTKHLQWKARSDELLSCDQMKVS